MAFDFLGTAITQAFGSLEVDGPPYALIGGLAAVVRGCMRMTMDVDVSVLGTVQQQDQVRRNLLARGFEHDESTDRIQLGDVTLLRFWRPLDEAFVEVVVDLQFSSSDLVKCVVERATLEQFQGVSLRVATTEDIVILKLISFRPLDRGDAIDLLTLSQVDWAYLRSWCDRLGVRSRLEEVAREVAR